MKIKINYPALCIAATTSLYSSTTLAAETDPIYIGKCETTEACSLSNMRKSLTSSGNDITTYLIKNEVSAEVNQYTSEFATSEFGRDRYIVRNKGIVTNALNDAVSGFIYMKESPNEGGLSNLGYVQVAFYNSIGPIFINPTQSLTLETLGWRISQMTQAIANDQASKINSLFNSIQSAGISGSISGGKFVTASIGGNLIFKTDGPTVFGVKDGPVIYILKGTKTDNMINIVPVKLVLLDADGNQILEVPFDGNVPNFNSISGQFVGMSAATQTLWANSFLSVHIELKNCNQLGCYTVITDPKTD